MTGGEAIDLLGAMRGGLDEHRRADLLQRFELDPTKRGRQYSKGNRQKVAIVAALASDVELLILDEPTSGLDPLMENVFQEVVGEAVGRGATVLLSSHIMAEVEMLADQLSIIRDGVIVSSGTLGELRGQARTTIRAELAVVPAARLIKMPAGVDPQVGAAALLLMLVLMVVVGVLDFRYMVYAAIGVMGLSGLFVFPFLSNISALTRYVNALAQDKRGNLLVLFSSTPCTMGELNARLLALPLEIERAEVIARHVGVAQHEVHVVDRIDAAEQAAK